MIKYELKGLSTLEKNLKEMPTVMAVKWLNGGLRAGLAKTILLKAKSNVPIRSGALRDSIRVGRGKKDSGDNRRDYYVIAGKRKKGGGGTFYAHIVEGGARPHAIAPASKKALAFPVGEFANSVKHPGIKASRFLERAFQDQGQQAVVVFGNYLKTKLDRTGLFNAASETE